MNIKVVSSNLAHGEM